MSDINLTEISGPIAEAIDVLRVCTEQSVYDADNLIAKLLTARSRAERAGIALHLAEKFVAMVIAGPIDPGTTVVGRDLIAAINRAKGVPCVLAHYQSLAHEASAPTPPDKLVSMFSGWDKDGKPVYCDRAKCGCAWTPDRKTKLHSCSAHVARNAQAVTA